MKIEPGSPDFSPLSKVHDMFITLFSFKRDVLGPVGIACSDIFLCSIIIWLAFDIIYKNAYTFIKAIQSGVMWACLLDG